MIIQCFDPAELGRIRSELNAKFTLVQLLEEDGLHNGVNFTYWNSLEGLQEIATFADGIGPGLDQLVTVDAGSGKPGPSELHRNARSLDLFMHPYTFRVDSLPAYVGSYAELLELFVVKLAVEGIFTDFPDVSSEFVHGRFKVNSGYRSTPGVGMAVLVPVIVLFFSLV